MAKLPKDQFEEAKTFLKTKARPLERAIFEYNFEAGSSETIIKELERYQNADGGFGNALEPDFRCEASSALASTVALQHLSNAKVGADNEMVKKVINYLVSTLKQDTRDWDKVPKEVESTPRAPWWNYNEPHSDWGNPSAEILGFFYEYRELAPTDLLVRLTQDAVDYLNRLQDYEFHELLCFLRCAQRLPDKVYNLIAQKLDDVVQSCVSVDPEEWNGYCLQPLQVVGSPESRYYPLFADSIPANLDHLIGKQTGEGCWEPTWNWGQYEDTWPQAKEEWMGCLTIDYLKLLRSFGCLEGGNE